MYKKNLIKKFFFTKADFRAVFLLFTALVRSRSLYQPLVPGILLQYLQCEDHVIFQGKNPRATILFLLFENPGGTV